MIFLIIVLVGTSSLTIYFASKENNTASFMQGENNVSPNMPSGEEGQPGNNNSSDTLDNVTIEDTNNKLNGKSTTYKNIFLYQSMSGDADTGVATFKSSNSKITTNKGDTLYVNGKAIN